MRFTDNCKEYADKLRDAGFTVYAPTETRGNREVHWFHYSREVEGQTYYGTYDDGSQSFDGPEHRMPLKPNRLNGSSANIGARWGDTETMGLDTIPVDSVQYARIVTRERNWCPFNYAESPERLADANRGRTPGRTAQTGAFLPNGKPWGIGVQYRPVTD